MGRGDVGTRLRLVVALWLPALALVLAADGPVGLAASLAAGLAVALVTCAAQVRLAPAATPAHVRAVALRERARHTNSLRLRDPDAPGRTRPRAPSAGSPAA